MVYAHLAAAHGTSPAKRTWSRSGANGEELHLSARVANWEINSIANHSKGLGEAWWLSCGKSECQSVLQVGCLDEFSHAGAPLEMRPTTHTNRPQNTCEAFGHPMVMLKSLGSHAQMHKHKKRSSWEVHALAMARPWSTFIRPSSPATSILDLPQRAGRKLLKQCFPPDVSQGS